MLPHVEVSFKTVEGLVSKRIIIRFLSVLFAMTGNYAFASSAVYSVVYGNGSFESACRWRTDTVCRLSVGNVALQSALDWTRVSCALKKGELLVNSQLCQVDYCNEGKMNTLETRWTLCAASCEAVCTVLLPD